LALPLSLCARLGRRALLPTLALLFALAPLAGICSAADFAWTEEDWSGGAYEAAAGIDPEIWPGALVLENQADDMRFVAQPTHFEGIWALAVYHDTLFLGAGHYPINHDGADVLAYDYTSDSFSLAYQPYEQGLVAMKVYGDTLYIPGPDSQGSWDWGNVYLYDGASWIRKETIPGGVHVFDLAILDNVIYCSGGRGDLRTAFPGRGRAAFLRRGRVRRTGLFSAGRTRSRSGDRTRLRWKHVGHAQRSRPPTRQAGTLHRLGRFVDPHHRRPDVHLRW
jgi:hypothetical protein